jgi:hypothetical protein
LSGDPSPPRNVGSTETAARAIAAGSTARRAPGRRRATGRRRSGSARARIGA